MRIARRQTSRWRLLIAAAASCLLLWLLLLPSGAREKESPPASSGFRAIGRPIADVAASGSKRTTAAALQRWVQLTDVQQAGGGGNQEGEAAGQDPSEAGPEEGESSASGQGQQDEAAELGRVGEAGGSATLGGDSLRCPPLSRELLQRRAKRNTVMLGVMSAAQTDFGLNWLEHTRRVPIDYFLLGAADARSSALLAGRRVPCFELRDKATEQLVADSPAEFEWGRAGWRRMTWQKVFLLDKVVDWGFNIVISDMDVAWFRDPLPLFDEHPLADVMFSTDGCATTNDVGDQGLEKNGNMHHNWNTGVYLLRATPASVAWAHAWRAAYDSGGGGNDQEEAYRFTRVGDVQPHAAEPRLSTAWEGKLYLGVLPTHLLSNAHTFTVQQLHKKMGSEPFEMHATWTYGGVPGKRARLRDALMWFDDDAYYSEGSFVTVDVKAPKAPEGFNDFQENEDMISFHLAAIHGQLYQAYLGMALAAASGRAFISPKFQCFCEKIWYAVVHCRVVDAQDLQFPIVCPTDYIFQPGHFSDNPAQYGTPLDFREPSFLDNPRTPPAVKNSVLVLQPSASLGCSNCAKEERKPDGTTVLRVPVGLKDTQLLPILKRYTAFRVWRLSFEGVKAPGDAFAGFSCAGVAREFDKRMQHITTEWCCRREEEAKEFDPPLPINVPLAMAPDSSKLSAQPGLDSSC